jgi:Tetratricopeptide repeat/LytR cell envelope-related transcriptional attenuator
MRTLLTAASGIALTAMLAACALLPHGSHMVRMQPVMPPAAAPGESADDGIYASATRAIEQRNYAAALELLQSARDQSPQDVRLLNALGVVYDKLGRFDLSARYYAQAQALDPASPIVRENLAYSARLQAVERRSVLAAEAPATHSNTLVTHTDSVETTAVVIPAAPAPTPVRLALTGHPLVLTNASGSAGYAEPLRLRLRRLGWSAPATALRSGPVQNYTQIVYAPADQPVARALARTIAVKVRMDACDGCEGVRLIVGTDSLNWRLPTRHSSRRRV